jgi:hypothetical protein
VIIDLGPATYFLGVELKPIQNGLFMHQAADVRTILESHDMTNCNSAPSPMDPGLQEVLTSSVAVPDDKISNAPYRMAIGQLLYLTTKTRPDIAVAVGILS